MQDTTPRFYTTKDLARLFGVHRKTIYVWQQEGKIPQPTRVLGRARWPRGVIDKLVAKIGAGVKA